MAGRKKFGDLGRVISCRLDLPVDAQIRRIADESREAQGKPGEVIRDIITDWVISQNEPISAYQALAQRVYPIRRGFGARAEAARKRSQKGSRE